MGRQSKKTTLILGGQSRLPKELSAGEVFQVIVEVELDTGDVIEASFGPCLPIIREFLRQLIVGISLKTEVNKIMEVIDRRVHHRSKKAILAAIKDVLREYKEYQYQLPMTEEDH